MSSERPLHILPKRKGEEMSLPLSHGKTKFLTVWARRHNFWKAFKAKVARGEVVVGVNKNAE